MALHNECAHKLEGLYVPFNCLLLNNQLLLLSVLVVAECYLDNSFSIHIGSTYSEYYNSLAKFMQSHCLLSFKTEILQCSNLQITYVIQWWSVIDWMVQVIVAFRRGLSIQQQKTHTFSNFRQRFQHSIFNLQSSCYSNWTNEWK